MNHRVRVLLAAAAALAAMVVSASASADRPVKEPIPPPPPASFPAGMVCSFPVTIETPTSRTFTTTHLDKDGNVRWIWGGGSNVLTATNELNHKSVTVNASGPGKFVFNDDGSASLTANGTWVFLFFPTDSPASSLLVLSGRTEATIASDGTLTLVSHTGTTRDLCAELA
jgi:hypothetical protein